MNANVLSETTSPEYEFLYLDIGSVGTGFLTQRPARLLFKDAPSRARRVVRKGDTIVSTVRTYLKGVYFITEERDDIICSTGFAVLTPQVGTVSKFVSYLVQSNLFTDRVTAESVGTTYPAIGENRLGSFRVLVPPQQEQAAIVRFLDHAEVRIRRYIRAKQKLIKVLEDQKRSIVHHAVTHGLDPSVPLKSSGVAWVGDVPEHWEVVPNRAVLKLRKDIVGNGSGDYTLLSLTKRGIIPRDMENPEGKFPSSFDTYQVVEAGDLIFCLFDIDETPRAVGLATMGGMITGAYTRFECSDPDVAEFVYAFYVAMDDGKYLKPLYTGLRKVITKSTFLSAKMPLPPREELQKIVKHIQERSTQIDSAKARAETEIALLREYRSSLIADVVSGSLDVREAAAILSEEAPEVVSLDEIGDVQEDEVTADAAELEAEDAA